MKQNIFYLEKMLHEHCATITKPHNHHHVHHPVFTQFITSSLPASVRLCMPLQIEEFHYEVYSHRLLFVYSSIGLAGFRLFKVNRHPCPGTTTLHTCSSRKWLADLH